MNNKRNGITKNGDAAGPPVESGDVEERTASNVADALARFFDETYPEAERGVMPIPFALRATHSPRLVCVYNSYPYESCPGRRDREFREMRLLMKCAGITELAYAQHPIEGPGAGYTVVIVARVSTDRDIERLELMYQKAVETVGAHYVEQE